MSVEQDKMVAALIYFDFRLSLCLSLSVCLFCSFEYPYLYLTE